MSLMDDIYNGVYDPSEQVKPRSKAFLEHSRQANLLAARLDGTLTEEQRLLLDEYKTEAAIVENLYDMEFFRAGVKFGIRLLLEALDGCRDLPDMHK